jgi:hypothetical protein
VIPIEATEALVSPLEAIETPCDVGRQWDIDYGGKEDPACPRPAEWSALAHDCHLGLPILLCTKHLAACREDRMPDSLLKWRCKRCGHIGVSNDEMVWNVRRIA